MAATANDSAKQSPVKQPPVKSPSKATNRDRLRVNITKTNIQGTEVSYVDVKESDGDFESWPEEGVVDSTGGYYTTIGVKSSKYGHWCESLGDQLAREFRLRKDKYEHFQLIQLPEGYGLFDYHPSPDDDTPAQPITYIFGNKNKKGYKSATDFYPHLRSLCDPSFPCFCSVCMNKDSAPTSTLQLPPPATSSSSRSGSGLGRPLSTIPRKRHAMSYAIRKRSRTQVFNSSASRRQLYPGPYINKDRPYELTEDFRTGELVWVKIDPIIGRNCAIEYWPGIVSIMQRHTETILIKKNAPPKPHKFKVEEYYIPRVRLLGLDSVNYDSEELLPWLAYQFPEELFAMDLQSPEAVAMIHDEEINDIRIDKLPLSAFKTAESAITTFALANEIANKIIAHWCFIDRFFPPPNMFEKDIPVRKHSLHFQGLWFGCEKVWAGDVVRLILFDETLPDEKELQDPKTCCVMRTNLFYRDSDSTCAMMAGSIWKLIPIPFTPANSRKYNNDEMPAAPEGMMFKRVTPLNKEHELSISHLAGRYYPPITLDAALNATTLAQIEPIDHHSLNYHAWSLPCGDPMDNYERVLALAGLRSPHRLFIKCAKQVTNRKDSVMEAEKQAEVSICEALNS